MVLESWAIIVLVILMWYAMWRAGKREFSLAILPLIIVPLFHLSAAPISRLAIALDIANRTGAYIGMDVIGLVIASVLFGVISRGVESTKLRRGYLIICSGFTIILTWVYIYNVVTL